MAEIVSPAGTRAVVGDELAAVMLSKGWSSADDPKRKPGRPKKTGE